MNCITFCSIGIVLFIANLMVCLTVDKNKQKEEFYQILTPDLIKKYESIINDRKEIYIKGHLLGLLVSGILIGYTDFTSVSKMCIAGGVTLLTNYLFYILHPKRDSMILHLNDKKQRQEWHKIYRNMQLRYHSGLVLGIGAAVMFAGALCKASN